MPISIASPHIYQSYWTEKETKDMIINLILSVVLTISLCHGEKKSMLCPIHCWFLLWNGFIKPMNYCLNVEEYELLILGNCKAHVLSNGLMSPEECFLLLAPTDRLSTEVGLGVISFYFHILSFVSFSYFIICPIVLFQTFLSSLRKHTYDPKFHISCFYQLSGFQTLVDSSHSKN